MNSLSGSLLGLISALFSPVPEVITIDELAHLDRPQHRVEVLATYQGRVGQELQVDGFEATLTLAPICKLPRRGDDESPMLGLTLLPLAVTDQHTNWIVVGSRLIESPQAAFRAQLARARVVQGDKRWHLCHWILRSGNFEADAASKFWRELAPAPGSLEAGLKWIDLGRKSLGNSSEFLSYVRNFHRQQQGVPQIEDQLEALGLILVGDDWQDIAGFHRGLGMVERQGSLITLQRARLLAAVSNWVDSGEDPEDLRTAIEGEIAGLTKGGKVIAGLVRDEVIHAWGNPHEVTWLRKGNRFYEGWYWPQREVHLVDGIVFGTLR